MKIQKANLTDINAIVKITRTKENRKALPWVMKVTLTDAIEHPEKNILLVAKDKMKNVVGFIRSYCRRDNIATFHEIAILDEMKGKGIGSKLMTKAIKIAKQKKCEIARFKTPTELTKSHDFFASQGFIKTGEEVTKTKRVLLIFQKQI